MSLQEMGKKIRKSLKERYCDIVSRFINFHLPDDPVHCRIRDPHTPKTFFRIQDLQAAFFSRKSSF